jgi:alkanesulfonate monooxygenase SsuD/methylene tetrahydromethanopterin reductase-like flavin-dependent oxidoreductase (luciferase family)
LVLGVGVGWMREEIELLGGDYDRRGAWSDEALAVMRACWRDVRAAHHGEFFSFDEIGVFPKPTRGDIPILSGGHTPRALRRVVELGDGWHAAFIAPAALEADIARLRAECARRQRPFDQITISVRAGLSLRDAPLGPDRKPLQGSRDQVIADLAAFRVLGVVSMLLQTRYRDLDDMIGIYVSFAADLRPRISAPTPPAPSPLPSPPPGGVGHAESSLSPLGRGQGEGAQGEGLTSRRGRSPRGCSARPSRCDSPRGAA